MIKISHIHFVSTGLCLILGLVLPDPSLAETTRYYDSQAATTVMAAT